MKNHLPENKGRTIFQMKYSSAKVFLAYRPSCLILMLVFKGESNLELKSKRSRSNEI